MKLAKLLLLSTLGASALLFTACDDDYDRHDHHGRGHYGRRYDHDRYDRGYDRSYSRGYSRDREVVVTRPGVRTTSERRVIVY